EPATEARERPIDFLARLVQDELLRRRDRLLEAIARFVDIARRLRSTLSSKGVTADVLSQAAG
ncbi:MAG: hypothetical protein ACREK9_05310, partial [Candidatus Rokuibacteriota bacterium]